MTDSPFVVFAKNAKNSFFFAKSEIFENPFTKLFAV